MILVCAYRSHLILCFYFLKHSSTLYRRGEETVEKKNCISIYSNKQSFSKLHVRSDLLNVMEEI